MMGVYIANAEMPKTCEDCGFDFIGCDLYKRTNAHEYRHSNCPLENIDLVRCGECKHLKADGTCNMFADDNLKPSVSDFCSYGERRTDE